jgi:hypothetical protein
MAHRKSPRNEPCSGFFRRPGHPIESVVPYVKYFSETTPALQIVCKRWSRRPSPEAVAAPGINDIVMSPEAMPSLTFEAFGTIAIYRK